MSFVMNVGGIIICLWTMHIVSEDMFKEITKSIRAIREQAMPKTTVLGKILLFAVVAFLMVWKLFFWIAWQLDMLLKPVFTAIGKAILNLLSVLFLKKV